MITPRIIPLAAALWLWYQIGLVIQANFAWAQDPLFWPLWSCIALNIWLVAREIDRWRERRQRPAPPTSLSGAPPGQPPTPSS